MMGRVSTDECSTHHYERRSDARSAQRAMRSTIDEIKQ
jgi:hypothetical protein